MSTSLGSMSFSMLASAIVLNGAPVSLCAVGVPLVFGCGIWLVGVVGRLSDRRCADIERRLAGNRVLLRLGEVRARRSVFVDDALRQQVGDRLSLALRLVDTEGVVEAAVLTDQDDHVLDRRGGLHLVAVILVTMIAVMLVPAFVVRFVVVV
uniref:hypothetical protein n=1 Tax=Bradyrhizobium japonicum TaxID=375 RepID=UPI00384DC0A2